ncbi:SH3 domain-containing protein [Granulicoccus phenolivorans]|uniref:SH3 domain-containing protein n=1 Tax=Granulicoccus phenolivorans TaxID=266854 RepID=UPI0003FFEB9D|nr:SH3 domain-containing protein [Granulicoccus phenolivorans]
MNALRRIRTTAAFGSSIAVVAVTAAIGGVVVADNAFADPFSVTANGGLNVRSGPGSTYRVLGTVGTGAKVDSTGAAQNGWIPITYQGQQGWVSQQYLKADGSGALQVTAGRTFATTAVNVRSGASLNDSVIAVIQAGTEVQPTGVSSNGYTQINYNGQRRWVSSQYVSQPGPAEDPLPSGLTYTGTATATADLMIRSGSGADAQDVRSVPAGYELQLTGVTENGRSQVVFDHELRWVTSQYLSTTTSVNPPEQTAPKTTTKYATVALDIRSTSADNYTRITEVPAGSALEVTGREENGRAEIIYSGASRWVTAKYLSDTQPSAGTGSTSGGGSNSGGGSTGGSAGGDSAPGGSGWVNTPTSSGLSGLTATSKVLLGDLQRQFPKVNTWYGVRPDSLPDHPSGRAIDAMVYKDSATGQALAEWVKANAAKYNVEYVIWNQHIWSVARSSEGWRFMADRGSDTANHKDHVHITVKN